MQEQPPEASYGNYNYLKNWHRIVPPKNIEWWSSFLFLTNSGDGY